jgi:thiol-disulfide isomerase/thioredoxin
VTWRLRGASRPLRIAAAGVALLAVLAGCTGVGASPDRGNDTRYIAGNGTIGTVAVGDRKPAPNVSGTTLEGEPLDLAAYRGQVVVLNFWASWCPPCRAEAADLERVYQDTRSMGVQFIGVNIKDDSRKQALTFQRTFTVTYPSLYDQPGSIALLFRDTLPPQAIPSTLVIDRNGKLAARGLGGLTAEELEPVVTAIAAEQVAGK